MQLFKKGYSIQQIAAVRNIKEGTVWEHFTKLIEWHQLSVWRVLPRDKVIRTLVCIHTETDLLKDIKQRLNDSAINFNEISCVFAHFKARVKKRKSKRKHIQYILNDRQNNYQLSQKIS